MPARRTTHLLAAAMVGYAAGLVPSASLAARAATRGAVDIRSAGSGNPGGANAAAVLGRRWGYCVMAADVAKGAAATLVGRRLAGDSGQHLGAVAAVAGHCYPITHGFRGGKGVSTSVGQCLATLPWYVPIDLGVALLVASGPWKQRAFAATAVSSLLWVGAGALWWREELPNGWGGRPSASLPVAAAVSSAMILQRFVAEKSRAARR